ncbi:unnamed protein product [Rotaria magnacalcarata]|uniref:Reverse transcriptase domain-containing protein n=1 Tax=Rotaria magnacalcarata TaxID=392030 RepID=A0A816SX43_9BILA|nr:unnamed protein product [Rotaria magnacalcarata]
MKHIIGDFQKEENDEQYNAESGYAAFSNYNESRTASRERNQQKRTNCPDSNTVVGRGFLAPTVINDTHTKLTEDEYQLLKLGPRFIYNDPKAASQRRATELTTLKRKIEARFFEKKVSPGRPVENFIAELDIILCNLHNTPININTHRQHKQQQRIISYDNLLTTIQSSQSQIDNALVMNQQKKKNYAKWITQKQYERLCVKPDEVTLAHLYYSPKAHKAGTPFRPIVSGLKHPTIKISKYLDELLRPLFDKIALKTTVTSGFEVIKQLHEWSTHNLHEDTLLCAIYVVDLYTMIQQTEGVLAIKKMLDYLKNNYFSYEDQYYHQIRGVAMGSPLTLTIANCYMFFFKEIS